MLMRPEPTSIRKPSQRYAFKAFLSMSRIMITQRPDRLRVDLHQVSKPDGYIVFAVPWSNPVQSQRLYSATPNLDAIPPHPLSQALPHAQRDRDIAQ
ncbi:hypothetical protein VTK73DRAFT_5627 [Phialemonium thermophilum]|uniref:Uncharacterized protein n=1 Tax=Phialemonium thermophilum TaxID=223376 RepID=A0ABR3V179_9PEZI